MEFLDNNILLLIILLPSVGSLFLLFFKDNDPIYTRNYAMVIAFIGSYPWLRLSIFLIGYLMLIPFSIKAYKRYESGEEVDEDIEEGTEDFEPL